jgi:hypothetical protein
MLQKNKFLVASSDSVTTLLQNQSYTRIMFYYIQTEPNYFHHIENSNNQPFTKLKFEEW